MRNYQNAARAAGGQILYDRHEETTLRLSKGDREVSFSIAVGNKPSGVPIMMVVVEKTGMKQDVTLDATAMAQGISEAGRIAVYGILFDTGKAEVKPESSAALQEIAKLLKQNPTLKLYVVGHTDMIADVATQHEAVASESTGGGERACEPAWDRRCSLDGLGRRSLRSRRVQSN